MTFLETVPAFTNFNYEMQDLFKGYKRIISQINGRPFTFIINGN